MSASEGSPYPGPRPYRWSEAQALFGRDKEEADLRNLVVAYRVTLLYAESGAGKSSLIARLGPALQERGTCVLTSRVGVGCMPSPTTNVFVRSALATLTFGEDELAVPSELTDGAATLHEGMVAALEAKGLVAARTPPPRETWELNRPCVVVFDQLEELFTTNPQHWPDRKGFFENVAGACARMPDLNVLLIIREDYLAQLDRYASLLPQSLRIRYRLERLRKPEAISAVQQPLLSRGIGLPDNIADTVVTNLLRTRVATRDADPDEDGTADADTAKEQTTEIEGEFVEPIHLQIACVKLWEVLRAAPDTSSEAGAKVDRRTAFEFERDGRVFITNADTIGSIEESLRDAYEQAIRRAARSGVREGKLRAFVERRLITRAQTRGFVDRVTYRRYGIPDVAMETLVDARIIRREPRAGADWYELTHDRLVGPILVSAHQRSERRRQRIAGAGVSVLAAAVVILAVAGHRSSQQTARAAATDETLTAWRSQLAAVTLDSGSMRPKKGAKIDDIVVEAAHTRVDMAPPAVASQSYEDLIKTLKAELDARQRLLDSLREENARKDEIIAQLNEKAVVPSSVPRERHGVWARIGTKLSPATPLSPVAWLNDIQPRVEATRLPETTGIYRFSIHLDIPPERRDRVQEVQYVFDHPTFRSGKLKTSRDAGQGFPVGYVGWGCLTNVVANVMVAEGDPLSLPIDMCAILNW